MTKSKPAIKFKCNVCGKLQEPNLKQSNKNWEVYPNVKCSCGGVFNPDFSGWRKVGDKDA